MALRFLDFFVQNPQEHLPFSNEVSFDCNKREPPPRCPSPSAGSGPSFPENYAKLVIADYTGSPANAPRCASAGSAG